MWKFVCGDWMLNSNYIIVVVLHCIVHVFKVNYSGFMLWRENNIQLLCWSDTIGNLAETLYDASSKKILVTLFYSLSSILNSIDIFFFLIYKNIDFHIDTIINFLIIFGCRYFANYYPSTSYTLTKQYK